MKKWLILIAMLMVIVPQANAGVVTFDDAFGNSIVGTAQTSFSDQGLTFTNFGTYMYVWGPAISPNPNGNGTNSLIFAGYGANDYLTITKTGGGTFDLYSLDMALSWYNTSVSETILVNGSPITLIQGLQNYVLNLLGVTQVTITGVPSMTGYWLADNINTNVAAPLPGGLLLLGSGLVGLIGLRRRS
jgi:hypothetical protein